MLWNFVVQRKQFQLSLEHALKFSQKKMLLNCDSSWSITWLLDMLLCACIPWKCGKFCKCNTLELSVFATLRFTLQN